MTRAAAALALAAGLALPVHTAEDVGIERAAYLMGTRARLFAYGPDRPAGLATLEAMIDVLESAEAALSTWRADSAISRLNRTPVGARWTADAPLCRLFADLAEWHEATGGAFDPVVGALVDAWGIHDTGRIPDAREIAAARRLSGMERLLFDRRACTVTRRAEVAMDAGGFGKGEGLDRVAESLPGVPWMVDLGGQVMVGGPRPGGRPWPVALAHPLERDVPYLQLELERGSLATSGSSERDLTVEGTRVGHILDPRTGRPAPFTGSVTVWHERGLVADILSTALYVMGPREGIAWARARDLSVCYLIPQDTGDVEVLATDAFLRLVATGARPRLRPRSPAAPGVSGR